MHSKPPHPNNLNLNSEKFRHFTPIFTNQSPAQETPRPQNHRPAIFRQFS
jgi:hypothetical protein